MELVFRRLVVVVPVVFPLVALGQFCPIVARIPPGERYFYRGLPADIVGRVGVRRQPLAVTVPAIGGQAATVEGSYYFGTMLWLRQHFSPLSHRGVCCQQFGVPVGKILVSCSPPLLVGMQPRLLRP